MVSDRLPAPKSALRYPIEVRYAVAWNSPPTQAPLGPVEHALRLPRISMADKPPLSINYHTGTIQGPSAVMSRLFATPKTKSWDWLPEATIVISDPQRLQQTVARLRQLGYPLVESPIPHAE